MKIRILEEGDEPALEAFLSEHSDTSMILRGNVRLVGIVDTGARYQGSYAAAFEGKAMVGVVAHYWNGNLIPQAPRGLARLIGAAVKASGRKVAGVLGPADQVCKTLDILGISHAPTRLDAREGLYALDLIELRWPTVLRAHRIEGRQVQPCDRRPLVDWFDAYAVETLGASVGPDTRSDSEHRFERSCAEAPGYVLLRDGLPVAYSGFNAEVVDAVQIGGVYTPPEERGKGFARGAVAHSLRVAKDRGVKRAVLFTGESNAPAIAAYSALGFRRVGDFRLTLLA